MLRGSPYCVVFLLASFGIFLLWAGAGSQDNYTAEESALAPSPQTVPTQSLPAVSCRLWYTPRRLHPERPSREHGTASQETGWQGEEAWQLRRPKQLSGIWPSSSRYDGTSRYYVKSRGSTNGPSPKHCGTLFLGPHCCVWVLEPVGESTAQVVPVHFNCVQTLGFLLGSNV